MAILALVIGEDLSACRGTTMTISTPDEEAIFKIARQIVTEDARRAYLDQVCAGNTALRDRVKDLLQAEKEEDFLVGPAIAMDQTAGEAPGTIIGEYKLLEQIGEGGFGIVFMAEQTRPVRRLVALKLLKPGMDTKQVVARFEAERQALALMDHPHIAHVFDGGETPAGRPYFVMELVRGVPITDFSDQNQLPVADRLRLFVNVCLAVQHAHQKGVIHRDLKPTNVLVTLHDTAAVPKVIDFGVAKALGQRLTDKTLFTSFAQMVGTPMYMSPEQAQMSGLDVDTRTDVYALGVLLYELLTGTTPFDKDRLGTAAYDEMRRIIREEEPPKPSTRLSTLAAAAAATVSAGRNSDPRRLSQLIRGELDWIVMKSLEKDRKRRYESAGSLAGDVERYLRDEAVHACPPTAAYRFRKFARRNKRALTTAALAGLMSLTALGVTAASIGWAARDRAARTADLEHEAGRALDEAESWYARDNVPEALAAVKRAEALLAGGGGSEAVRELVGRWRTDLSMVSRLDEIRLLQAELREGGWFHYGGADPAYAEAFKLYDIDLASLDPADAVKRVRASAIREHLVVALDDWVWVKPRADVAGRERILAVVRQADPDGWRNRFRDPGLRGNRKALEALADRPEVADLSATSVVLLGRALQNVGAIPKSLTVLTAAQERHPNDFWLNIEVGGVLLWKMNPPRAQRAAQYFRAALALRPNNAGVYCNLAGALRHSPDELDQAITAYRKAISLRPDYPDAHKALAEIFQKQGNPAEAIALYRDAVRASPNYYRAHSDLAVALHKDGQIDEAIVEFEEAIRLNGSDAVVHHNLAAVLAERGPLDEAIAEHRKAIALKPDFLAAQRDLGIVLHNNGQIDEAIVEHRKAIELRPRDAGGHNNLGVSLREQGQAAESIAEFRQAVALNPKFGRAHFNLALALGDAGDRKGALAEYREAIACYSNALESDPRNARLRNVLAWLLATCAEVELRDASRAVALASEAVKITPLSAENWNTLGTAHYRSGDYRAAITAVNRAVALRRRDDSFDWFVLAMAHWKLRDKDQARKCYDEGLRRIQTNRRDRGELSRFQSEAAELLEIKKKDK